MFSLIDYEPPTYHNGDYIYPWWAEAIGWGIASLSLICIPAFAVYVLVRADGVTFAEVRHVSLTLIGFPLSPQGRSSIYLSIHLSSARMRDGITSYRDKIKEFSVISNRLFNIRIPFCKLSVIDKRFNLSDWM